MPFAGVFRPRIFGDNNRRLPSARRVSRVIVRASAINVNDAAARESAVNSVHMMQVGQFLDHDFAHTPAQSGECLYVYLDEIDFFCLFVFMYVLVQDVCSCKVRDVFENKL